MEAGPMRPSVLKAFASGAEAATHLKQSINYDINVSKVLEALTAPSCQEAYCYERTGLLGNVYLKWSVSTKLFLNFPTYSEGELSRLRQKELCKTTLRSYALANNLGAYIQLDPVVIPMRVDIEDVKQAMLNNRLPDVVEALVGTFYAEKGHRGAKHAMNWMGIATMFSREEARHAMKGNQVPASAVKAVNFGDLETALGYKFKQRSLLVEALTHASYGVPSYGRLAFVGDAVLDYLITAHIYFHNKQLAAGSLTDLRAANVNNDNFARAAVKHRLYLHIVHRAVEIQQQIDDFVLQSDAFSSEVRSPKVLADLVESIAGAVFVDCGLKVDHVWKIFKPLLLVKLAVAPIHPVRQLNEYCQQNAKVLEWRYVPEGDMADTKVFVDGVQVGAAQTTQKRQARKIAASRALQNLKRTYILKAFPQAASFWEEGSEFCRRVLHELCDRKGWSQPHYEKACESGLSHARMYTCTAKLGIFNVDISCTGEPRRTLSKAKDSAAMFLVELLMSKGLV